MKQTILSILCAALMLGLVGCVHEPPAASTSGGPLPTESIETTSAPAQPTETAEPTEQTETAETTQPEETVPPTEATQPAPSLPEPEDAALARVLDYIPLARQQLAYATVNNFTGQRIYDFTDAYLRGHTVKKLKLVAEELAQQGLGLLIWDGFRPVSAQAKLWDICPDPNYVSHPVTGNRSHCRGSAVDLTLVELETGELLTMPTGFDDFTVYADRDYSDCSPEAAKNARLLETVMEKHGFKPYFAEWWHYTDTQSFPVEETFTPQMPMEWTANCRQYITLRKRPDGSSMTRIPAGDTVTWLGWEGKYAKVAYNGTEGYVLASYLIPKDSNWPETCLSVVNLTETYSYPQMLQDMQALAALYPQITEMETVGTSESGREIPVLRIGREDARYHVLLQGAIHGREHMTGWLLMAMAEYWLAHDLLSYGDICYHILPMVNPDGVMISQTGTLTDSQGQIYQRDLQSGYTAGDQSSYAAQWKANGLGVDINRNFPAGWETTDTRSAPSSQQYRGDAPFSSAEARVLRDYTLRYAFDATLSYHAYGSLIYYEYGSRSDVNTLSKSLGSAVGKVTGYPLEGSGGVDGAGYKDWAIDALGIPSLTVEIGSQDTPLALREIYCIFARNLSVLPEIARWLQR